MPPQDPACCAAARLAARRNLSEPGSGARQRSCSPPRPIGLSREQDLATRRLARRVAPTSPEASRAAGDKVWHASGSCRARSQPWAARAHVRTRHSLTCRRRSGAGGGKASRRPEPRPHAPPAPRRAGRGRGWQPLSGAGGAGQLAASNTFGSELCGSGHKQTNTAKKRPLPSDPSLLGSCCFSYWWGGYLFIWFFPPTLPLHAHAHAPSFLFLTPPLPPRPFSPRPQPSQLRTAQRTRHSSAPGYEGRARRGEAGAGAGGRAGRSGAVAGPRARAGARRRRSPRGRARSLGSAGELGGEAGWGVPGSGPVCGAVAGSGHGRAWPIPAPACLCLRAPGERGAALAFKEIPDSPAAVCLVRVASLQLVCNWCGSSFMSPFMGVWPFVPTLWLTAHYSRPPNAAAQRVSPVGSLEPRTPCDYCKGRDYRRGLRRRLHEGRIPFSAPAASVRASFFSAAVSGEQTFLSHSGCFYPAVTHVTGGYRTLWSPFPSLPFGI